MKILILGSISLPIPPPFSGGTERIAYEQALGAARAGHKVMIVGGKGTTANIKNEKLKIKNTNQKLKIEILEVSGGSMDYQYDPRTMESSRKLRVENALLAEVMGLLVKRRDDYDLVINNLRGGEAVLLPFLKLLGKPMFNVLHLPLFDELVKIFRQFQAPLVSISNSQRGKWPGLNWLGTVYNGVDIRRFRQAVTVTRPVSGNRLTSSGNGNDARIGDVKGLRNNLNDVTVTAKRNGHRNLNRYLLNISTIGWHKGQAIAVEVARRTGMKLILAGKIRDKDYFEQYIKPAVADGLVEYYGELDFGKKLALYQGALAFLFPIEWQEPFGLVMIEAMACGTPVVAFDRGSVSEVVADGETGYIINPKSQIPNPKQIQNANDQNSKRFEHLDFENSNLFRASNFEIRISGTEGMVEAVNKLQATSYKLQAKMRENCRKWVEENFTMEKMVEGYEKIYQKFSY